MKKLLEDNINTRTYWNTVYGSLDKRSEYASQGATWTAVGEKNIAPTYRFTETLSRIDDGQKVLDIGCGVGVFTKMVKTTYPNCEVWGTDISDQACHDNTMEMPSITYLNRTVGDISDLPTDFDIVFSGEVLEHIDDPSQLFKDAYSVLKPGGRFILTTPNGGAVVTPEHMHEFAHEDIEQLYIENGFDVPRFVYLPDMEHLLVIYAIGVKK